MTFFELYNTPIHLIIDKSALKKRLYELSKLYHPDKFVLATPAEQQHALKMIEQSNEGFKVLSHLSSRLFYALQILQVIEENEKPILPQDFLMEMMELNEAIMEAKLDNNTAEVEKEIAIQSNNLDTTITWAFECLDLSVASNAKLQELKNYYYKYKYILRLKDLLEDKNVEI